MSAAGELLRTFGRADAPDVVLFMTDGEANQPDSFNPCSYAVDKAAEVKAAGAQVFTIAYGVSRCRMLSRHDRSVRGSVCLEVARGDGDEFDGQRAGWLRRKREH